MTYQRPLVCSLAILVVILGFIALSYLCDIATKAPESIVAFADASLSESTTGKAEYPTNVSGWAEYDQKLIDHVSRLELDRRAIQEAVSEVNWSPVPVSADEVDPDSIRIPFYIYEQEFAKLEENCFNGLDARNANRKVGNLAGHFGEYYFVFQLKNHPWRVQNPEKALIFVIPFYGGAVYRGFCGRDALDLLMNGLISVKNSPWFKRHEGFDHISVCTDWHVSPWTRMARSAFFMNHKRTPSRLELEAQEIWKKVIYGQYEAGPAMERCLVEVPYTSQLVVKEEDTLIPGNLTTLTRSTLYEVGKQFLERRPYNYFFLGQAFGHGKSGYATRRHMLVNVRNHPPAGPNFIATGARRAPIPACPVWGSNSSANAQDMLGCRMISTKGVYEQVAPLSKYHIFLRGDEWSSRRLWDIVASGGLAVIISDGILDNALPFGCHVDYSSFLFFIPVARFEADPGQALRDHMPDGNDTETIIDLGRRLVIQREAMSKVLWHIDRSQTAEMTLRDAVRKCLPESHVLNWQDKTNPPDPFAVRTLRHLECPFADWQRIV